ncbi:hypothetical protein ABGV17_11170 [Guyparkeria sp. GHLCS8-2]|uniref:hypothetical protein n=1 Tax=Guyparkeria halopsychrophila TaxID=3139421 RepID=UPI0037CA51CC
MRFLILFLGLAVQSAALAGWTVESHTDAMTDEVKKKATVTNDLGNSFTIYRIAPGGEVWGNFALSERMVDQVDWRDPPIFRVDKHEPHDLEDEKKLDALLKKLGDSGDVYKWEPKWVNFSMWHGDPDEGIAPVLVEIMEGSKLIVRYHLGTGGYKDTTFTLKGSADAIAEAVGISPTVDHAEQQRVQAFKNAVLEASDQCKQDMTSMSDFKACMMKRIKCVKQADQDIQVFKSCFYD